MIEAISHDHGPIKVCPRFFRIEVPRPANRHGLLLFYRNTLNKGPVPVEGNRLGSEGIRRDIGPVNFFSRYRHGATYQHHRHQDNNQRTCDGTHQWHPESFRPLVEMGSVAHRMYSEIRSLLRQEMEYIIRVRPIVGSRRGWRTLWFSRVRVLLQCVTLCGAIADAEISPSSSSVVTSGASRQVILGDVPHSVRMPF